MAAEIRFFEEADAPALLALYKSAGHWFEDVDVNLEFILSSSQRPDFRFIVAEESGKLGGFVGALYFPLVGRAELGPIAVAEDLRGKGVGGMLKRAMAEYLAEKGIKRVYVKVKASNQQAIRFFLGEGFRHEAYLRNHTLQGEDVLQMTADL